MTDIEKTRGPTDRFVLLEYAAILDRHFPPGEIHQTRAIGRMEFPQWSVLQFAHE